LTGGVAQQPHGPRGAGGGQQQVGGDTIGRRASLCEQSGGSFVGAGPFVGRQVLVDGGADHRVNEGEHRSGRQHVGPGQGRCCAAGAGHVEVCHDCRLLQAGLFEHRYAPRQRGRLRWQSRQAQQHRRRHAARRQRSDLHSALGVWDDPLRDDLPDQLSDKEWVTAGGLHTGTGEHVGGRLAKRLGQPTTDRVLAE